MSDNDSGNNQSYPSTDNDEPRVPWGIKRIKRKLEQRRSEKQDEATIDKAACSTARATWALVFFAIVLGIIGYLQYRVTSGQLEEMRSGSDQVERAISASTRQAAAIEESNRSRIAVVGLDFEDALIIGKKNVIKLHYRNFGRLPANAIFLTQNIGFIKSDGRFGVDAIDGGPNTSCDIARYGNGQVASYPSGDKDSYFTSKIDVDDRFNDVLSDRSAFVVTGCIFYGAGAEVKYTGFCIEAAKGGSRSSMNATPFCAQGNFAN